MNALKKSLLFMAGATFLLLFTSEAIAQDIDCTDMELEEVSENITGKFYITEDDYPYMMDLTCLRNSAFAQNRGWSIRQIDTDRENGSYSIYSRGRGIKLKATYNKHGKLVSSVMRKRNSNGIPRSILQYVTSGDYEGCRIIGNETIVRNFDPQRTEYKMVVENDVKVYVLYFNYEGEPIARFSRR